MRLTIYYGGQFWVGVFEETYNAKLRACQYIFGPEPQDTEVLELINRKMPALIAKSFHSVPVEEAVERRVNPKRRARLAAEELKGGIATKAQLTLKKEYEHYKKEKLVLARHQRQERQQRKRELKKKKAQAKHRGH